MNSPRRHNTETLARETVIAGEIITMSAVVVCGKRTFEDHQHLSPPSSKRLRCCPARAPSPAAVYPPHSIGLPHLRSMFPDMDPQVLILTLDACGNDVESAIKRLSGLSIEEAEGNSVSALSKSDAQNAANAQPSADVLPADGSEWVELLVREMMSASSVDDAKTRASRVLGMLEKRITANAGGEAIHTLGQENAVLKEQKEVILQENTVLKQGVAILHKRLKNHDEQTQELQQLKQLVSQYQDQIEKLKMNNYALTMHLRQAQQSRSIPGHFHPDVY